VVHATAINQRCRYFWTKSLAVSFNNIKLWNILFKNDSPVLFYTCLLEAHWEILTVLLEGKTPLKHSIPANSRNRILEIYTDYGNSLNNNLICILCYNCSIRHSTSSNAISKKNRRRRR